MKYKAIISDIDGTLVPNKRDGLVSEKLTKAINKAKSKIHFGVATSRDLRNVSNVINHLSLSGPSILYGGAWIVDCPSLSPIWQKGIDIDIFNTAYEHAKKLGFYFVVNDNGKDYKPNEAYSPNKPINIWAHGLENAQLDEYHAFIKDFPMLTMHSVPSWQDGKIDFILNHTEATKQHAIFELAKLLQISTDEIIGIGDGAIDIPLLMACGLKIAVGNAVPELKEIADYIAPSVEEDGVADVIEKFVLS